MFIQEMIQNLECSRNHEYFGSLAKFGLHVNFARDLGPELQCLLNVKEDLS